jgi:hypothetical protein
MPLIACQESHSETITSLNTATVQITSNICKWDPNETKQNKTNRTIWCLLLTKSGKCNACTTTAPNTIKMWSYRDSLFWNVNYLNATSKMHVRWVENHYSLTRCSSVHTALPLPSKMIKAIISNYKTGMSTDTNMQTPCFMPWTYSWKGGHKYKGINQNWYSPKRRIK